MAKRTIRPKKRARPPGAPTRRPAPPPVAIRSYGGGPRLGLEINVGGRMEQRLVMTPQLTGRRTSPARLARIAAPLPGLIAPQRRDNR